jgi:hypothetical protein
MIRLEDFWKHERNAPLLDLNQGFIENLGDGVFERTGKWPSMLGISEVAQITYADDEPERIFILDAERTFFGPENRKRLVRILTHLSKKFADYHQALSYVTSFLLLTLDEHTTAAMLSHINSHPKFIPGYWRAEAVAFATDAYVFEGLLMKTHPEVAQHLQKNSVQPHTYCQKWFVGLCVNVLPYDALFHFFEAFFDQGFVFLMKFGLSLVEHIKEPLLNAKDPSTIFALLRLDPKAVARQTIAESIVKGAQRYDLTNMDFAALRTDAYDRHLRKSLEAAKAQREAEEKRLREKKANKGEDDDDDDSDEDSEDEEGEECQVCNNLSPDSYCKDCKLMICEECMTRPPKGHTHLKTHKTIPLSDYVPEEQKDNGKPALLEAKKDQTADLTEQLEKLKV